MLFTEVIKLVPGFRFCPTDEELVSYYLKRKVLGRLLPFEVIAEIELYKYEPWDLPEKSALPTRDLEWYFFIPRDRKYPNGSRTNRATVRGYWKSTGRDRSVFSNSRVVGTKKTLIYYNGRAPKGERTNWVMLEYRLNDVECQRIHAVENGYVLCRVYQKSGLGPKNGEQYGAPVEEDVFEDSPTVELDGCGSLKPQVIDGEPYNPKTFFGESCTVQGDSDCTSLGIDMIQQQLPFSGLEPRDLSVHFEKLYGNFQQESMQNFTCASGDVGKLVESVVAAPLTFEDEAEMLEQLLDECTDQLKSVDEYQNNPMFADDGCHLAGVHLPSDGDFLELNDLASVSDSEEGKTYVTDNEKNHIIGFKDYADESQDPLVQAPPTNDVFGECKNLLLGNALFEEEQVMPGVMEMQFISSTISCDSQQQFLRNCMLGQFPPPVAGHNEGTGPAGSPQPIEPDDEIGLKTVNHLTAYVSEKDNFRGFLESDGNPELLLQEGGYFDAVTLFTDELFEESTNTNLEGCNDHGIPQVTMASSHWANGVVESLDDRVLKAKDDGDSFQSEAICLEPGRRSPSSLSLISRLMGSLPTLPASAAELSPKAYAPGGSLHFRASEIAMGPVSGTCTCVGESVPSSCVSCSMTEIEKKGRFVKSMPFVRHTNRSLSRWDKGLLILAVFGGLLAVFIGVLVVAGTFKGLRGVCKLILSSKT